MRKTLGASERLEKRIKAERAYQAEQDLREALRGLGAKLDNPWTAGGLLLVAVFAGGVYGPH